ncbi:MULTISPECIES: iron uptake porin [unclassified Thermosynechococcus]|uniref:iron uptake porin n=1 Tax=unclassified Thermosynechococcus TaxID=2622553 RepID=UPI002671756B|nr:MULTISPECIES: iron uptake porin [unclassified Thermosynechococcus]WKT82588.1 iron uptake porin [Thermosynechococcus sp. HY596]WNC61713.1 iron uptake porin [Thermosynechococcus sp. HY591]WNC64267.1 iron uptake porin [Thermosynechococcus sp. HY593]
MARSIAVWLGLALAPAWGMSAALAANQLQDTPHTNDVSASGFLDDKLQQVTRSVKSPLQVAQVPAVADLEAQAPRLPAPAPSLGMQRTMPQVTSVNQLSDVRPTDWAYQALASLVEKYGCIAGYPDGTFRGNRAATRFEMAAALNACLDVISDRFASKEDLATLQRLAQELSSELAVIKGRVTNLEGRVANLEATQFSTTTKLRASVIFNVSDVLTGTQAVAANAVPNRGPTIEDNPVATYRARLNFDTSFYGKDVLRVRIQAANMPNYGTVTGTNMARLSYDTNTGGQFTIDDLYYRTPLTNRLFLAFDASAGNFDKNVFTFNPLLQSDETGAISRFGRFNPLYRFGGGAGLTLRYTLLENKERGTGLTLNLSYQAPNAANPDRNTPNTNGLFDGAYAALAQLDWRPAKNLAMGFTYVRSFGVGVAGGTGSSGFAGSAANPIGNNANAAADNFGFQFSYRPIQKFNIAGWVGYSNVYQVQGFTGPRREAEVLNWAATFAVPDIWRKGDVLGLIVGQPPQTISVRNVAGAPGATFNSYHIEGLYRIPISRNISITPGLIAVVNSNSNSNNAPLLLGVVRTTFSF